MPNSLSVSSSSAPDAPTNALCSSSSLAPGASPTIMILAILGPLPIKHTCSADSWRGHNLHFGLRTLSRQSVIQRAMAVEAICELQELIVVRLRDYLDVLYPSTTLPVLLPAV